jgi:hypothetical protein
MLPGLVGGLTVSLPYSALVVGRLLRRGLVQPGALARATGAGAALLAPVLLGVRALGRSVAWLSEPGGGPTPRRPDSTRSNGALFGVVA